jgi:DNA-binding response OmpR family regulator
MNTKILVIDDNEDILFMLKAMLQLKEYTVFTKENADNVESHIEQLSPDVILMDMLLSGADGREICKKIKENKAIASIPIVMMSALPSARQSCREAGADYFVGKPFEMGDMFNAIAGAVTKNEVGTV